MKFHFEINDVSNFLMKRKQDRVRAVLFLYEEIKKHKKISIEYRGFLILGPFPDGVSQMSSFRKEGAYSMVRLVY